MQEQVNKGDVAKRLFGFSDTAVAVTKGIITFIVATVTIFFLTFFLLLEGGAWVERFYGLLPERSQPRWRRIGDDIHKTIGGYITGNLLISLVAGDQLDDRAARRWACRSRSRSDCSSPSST